MCVVYTKFLIVILIRQKTWSHMQLLFLISQIFIFPYKTPSSNGLLVIINGE